MIKKILLTVGISLIGFINITFGVGEFVGQGKIGQYVLNPIDGDFYVGVDKNFNLKSIHNGEGKNIFVIYTGTLWGFYISNDTGKDVSLYANQWRDDGPLGGIMTYYYLCDYVNDTTFTTFSGCVQGNYGYAVNIEYISHLKVGDDYFFGSASLSSENHGNRRNPFIGFNISELNKSIVFYAKAEKSVNIGYGLPYSYSTAYGVNGLYYNRYDWDTFSGGLIYNNPYDLTLNGCIGPNCESDIDSSNISYKCTKDIALKWYEKNGYSSKLCYGGFDNFNLFTGAVNDLPFYGSGLDIEEIWFNSAQYRIYGDIGTGMGYNDWFHYWRLVYNSYYRTINQGGVMNNPFNNTPLVLFTYFSAVNQFGRNLRDKDILEYCDLKLYTVDYSAVYSGNYGDRVCSPLAWLEESVNNLNSSGNVNIGVNINGNFLTGNSGQNFTDGQSFIQSFVKFIDFDKFKGTNTGANGIIPGYIVLVLCALLFFRFLMH